jgi:hypothetical protein
MSERREQYTEDLLAFAKFRDQQSQEVHRGSYEAKLVDVFVNFKPGSQATCKECKHLMNPSGI